MVHSAAASRQESINVFRYLCVLPLLCIPEARLLVILYSKFIFRIWQPLWAAQSRLWCKRTCWFSSRCPMETMRYGPEIWTPTGYRCWTNFQICRIPLFKGSFGQGQASPVHRSCVFFVLYLHKCKSGTWQSQFTDSIIHGRKVIGWLWRWSAHRWHSLQKMPCASPGVLWYPDPYSYSLLVLIDVSFLLSLSLIPPCFTKY